MTYPRLEATVKSVSFRRRPIAGHVAGAGSEDVKNFRPAEGDELREIARNRVIPGILVFDPSGKLCLMNSRAGEILSALQNVSMTSRPGPRGFEGEIEELCRLARASEGAPQAEVFAEPCGKGCFTARALVVGSPAGGRPGSHVIVLLEKVAAKRDADWRKVREGYKLTTREMEVVVLAWNGLSNCKIGERLCISEHTVKDHLKNILRKMGVASRAEMIARIR